MHRLPHTPNSPVRILRTNRQHCHDRSKRSVSTYSATSNEHSFRAEQIDASSSSSLLRRSRSARSRGISSMHRTSRSRFADPTRGLSASRHHRNFCYTQKFGAVPKWPKGEVCKTSIRGFESHPRLQIYPFLCNQLTALFFPRNSRVTLSSSRMIGSRSQASCKSASI
jgi:hypothetical protein